VIPDEIYVTTHALERANERIAEGVTATMVKDLLRKQVFRRYQITDGIQTFCVDINGFRWVGRKEGMVGMLILTVYDPETFVKGTN